MQKRVLTKVRKNYIKGEDDGEKTQIVDPSTRYISDNNVYTLSSSRGLVEINRKIYVGSQYLNQHFNISKTLVKDNVPSRAVILNLTQNKQCNVPDEYVRKRLESYGDLELASWVHRVTNYRMRYPKLMENYLERRRQENPKEIALKKDNVNKICQEIERDYSYFKLLKVYNKEEGKPSELSFSESFLKTMGYSIEGILTWTKKNGIPPIFDHECPIYYQTTKKILDGGALSGNYIIKGEEYETSVIDNNGLKRRVVAQCICLIEPTEEGFAMHTYFVLKKRHLKSEALYEGPRYIKQKKEE